MTESVADRTRTLNAVADRVYDQWIKGLVVS
jgi:hypothetical protein